VASRTAGQGSAHSRTLQAADWCLDATPQATGPVIGGVWAMRSGVKVEDLTLGTGALAERGTVVTIHYRGFLRRGDLVRSSYDEGQPLRVHLGRREVIAGLERGMLGMRVGGRRRLVISPHLAYGAAGVPGVIPPNAVVIIEVELLHVQDPTTAT
jgi:FKBP-type peptidyl-prolyl cis-trans isomerase